MPANAIPLANQIIVAALVIIAAAYDFRFRRIPNWLVLAGIVSGFVLNIRYGGFSGFRTAGFGFLLAFGIYVVLFALRAMGAGDVKLMAGVGSLVGPRNWFVIFLITAVVGGLLALVLVIAKKRLRRTLWNVGFILREMMSLRAPYMTREEVDVTNPQAITLPHGVAIAAGTLLFLAANVF